jgi:hypothetical protein
MQGWKYLSGLNRLRMVDNISVTQKKKSKAGALVEK